MVTRSDGPTQDALAGWHLRAAANALGRRDPDTALEHAERAVALAPERNDCWNLFGVAAVQGRSLRGAETAFARAERAAPADPDAPRRRAEVVRRLGREGEALALLRAAAARGAVSADLLCDIADRLLERGAVATALPVYRTAQTLDPEHGRSANNRLEALRRVDAPPGRHGRETVAAAARLAALRPGPESLAAHAHALTDAGEPERAEALLRAADHQGGWHPATLIALGTALIHCGRHREAVAALQRALAHEPTGAAALGNLGYAWLSLHAVRAAEAAFRRALRLSPEVTEAAVGLGATLLLDGRLGEGAALYERRLALPAFRPPQPFSAPDWTGERRPGLRLLIHADRGLGDAIQFIRYARPLREAGMRVIFHGQESLLGLVRASGLVDAVQAYGTPPLPCDAQVHVLSLIHRMGTNLATVPGNVPYLRAPEPARARWRTRLAAISGLRVGLVWAGSAQFLYDRQRSPRLTPLQPLFAVDGVRVIGLQVGDGRRDLDTLAAPLPGLLDLGAELVDFADTAAVMEELDLVVSSCTATAHLAGALARPVAVLLHHGSEWRWLRERSDSPWYPTARLYRQPQPGDWATPVARLCQDLSAMVAGAASIPYG